MAGKDGNIWEWLTVYFQIAQAHFIKFVPCYRVSKQDVIFRSSKDRAVEY